jgi:hypothetical protein
MFCPPNYVSLAELWKEFFQKYRIPLTRIALEKYGEADFALGDKFGSTDDYYEDAFHVTLSEFTVSVVNADGDVMRLETELDAGRSQLFAKMSALESFIAANNPDEAGDENYWLRKLGADHFQPWNASTQKTSDWKVKYIGADEVLPAGSLFHTLPFVFERGRYVIPDKAPPWLSDVLDEHFLPMVIDRFRGRSLCMDARSVKKWRSDVIQKQSFLKKLEGLGRADAKVGRPNLVPRAMQDWQETFPEGRDVPWKLAVEKIRQKTGNIYSETTLRRAASLLVEK